MTHSFWLGNNIFRSLFGGLMSAVIQRKSNSVEPKRDQQVKKLGTKAHIQRSIPRPCMLEGEAFGIWALRKISVCIFKKTCKLAPLLHPMPCEGSEVGPDHTLELLEVWVSVRPMRNDCWTPHSLSDTAQQTKFTKTHISQWGSKTHREQVI